MATGQHLLADLWPTLYFKNGHLTVWSAPLALHYGAFTVAIDPRSTALPSVRGPQMVLLPTGLRVSGGGTVNFYRYPRANFQITPALMARLLALWPVIGLAMGLGVWAIGLVVAIAATTTLALLTAFCQKGLPFSLQSTTPP